MVDSLWSTKEMSKRVSLKGQKGVTIIELIMGIVIVGTLAGISSMYIKQVMDLWNFISFREETSSQGSTALIRIARELRQANDITTADAANLLFTADLDSDGTDDSVQYFRNAASELRRVFNNNNSGQGDILSSGLSGLDLTYYDANNSALARPVADPAEIKRIKIELTMQAGSQTKTLKTQIWPRNL